ncbi:MAG: hypothetical protein ACXAC7_15650 [Candidatus Hodarchaeales archaeon]|jgi:hypothetical protein
MTAIKKCYSTRELLEHARNYKETIDEIHRISDSVYESLIWNNTRSEILNVLHRGISEKISKKIFVRYILNAEEIQKALKRNYNLEIKKSNLYFHLKELEINKFVKKVVKKKEKNKYITYYGRTAQKILPKLPLNKVEPYKILESEKFYEFITGLMNSSKTMNVDYFKKQLTKINTVDERKIEEWLNENILSIQDNKLNLNDLYQLLILLYSLNDEIYDAIQAIKQFISI